MPKITLTAPVDNPMLDASEHVERYLNRAMPAVRYAFINEATGTLRSGVAIRKDRKAGTITVTIGEANEG